MVDSGHIVQITNVSPGATSEQLKALFGHLGTVEEIELYPKMQDAANPITRMAYVKFTETSSVDVAQHLTNTVFVDRALICVPFAEDIIPEESVAMQLPANVPAHAIPPSVVPTVDPAKLDEIQRTVYVGNLDSKTVTAEKLMTFFTDCGDVRFVRLAGDETQPTRFAFVEFGTTEHVLQAIMMNGMLFCERPIKINHSNNAIVKPPGKSADAREIDEAMRRVREAQSLIAKALEPEKGKPVKKPRTRSRSRSRHRRRRSKSRDRSRHHRRSHSRSRSSRRRSRSRSHDRRRSSHRRSRSRDRRRKRSHSHGRKSSRSPHKKSSSSSSKSHRKKDDRKRDRDHRSKRSKHDKDSGDERRSKKQKKKDDDSGSGSSSHRDKDENTTTTANGDHAPPPSATPTEEVKQEVAA